jgi:hypothetical protein
MYVLVGHAASIFRAEEQALIATCLMLVFYLTYSSILKMMATYSFKTLIDYTALYAGR